MCKGILLLCTMSCLRLSLFGRCTKEVCITICKNFLMKRLEQVVEDQLLCFMKLTCLQGPSFVGLLFNENVILKALLFPGRTDPGGVYPFQILAMKHRATYLHLARAMHRHPPWTSIGLPHTGN